MAKQNEGSRPKLKTPYYPSRDSEGVPFDIGTLEEKTVAEYANISFLQVYELDVFSYWALLRDAVIFNRSQTKKGREWLKNAWRIIQTKPDDKKLQQKFKNRR